MNRGPTPIACLLSDYCRRQWQAMVWLPPKIGGSKTWHSWVADARLSDDFPRRLRWWERNRGVKTLQRIRRRCSGRIRTSQLKNQLPASAGRRAAFENGAGLRLRPVVPSGPPGAHGVFGPRNSSGDPDLSQAGRSRATPRHRLETSEPRGSRIGSPSESGQGGKSGGTRRATTCHERKRGRCGRE